MWAASIPIARSPQPPYGGRVTSHVGSSARPTSPFTRGRMPRSTAAACRPRAVDGMSLPLGMRLTSLPTRGAVRAPPPTNAASLRPPAAWHAPPHWLPTRRPSRRPEHACHEGHLQPPACPATRRPTVSARGPPPAMGLAAATHAPRAPRATLVGMLRDAASDFPACILGHARTTWPHPAILISAVGEVEAKAARPVHMRGPSTTPHRPAHCPAPISTCIMAQRTSHTRMQWGVQA
jgi:hypothetical protein